MKLAEEQIKSMEKLVERIKALGK